MATDAWVVLGNLRWSMLAIPTQPYYAWQAAEHVKNILAMEHEVREQMMYDVSIDPNAILVLLRHSLQLIIEIT